MSTERQYGLNREDKARVGRAVKYVETLSREATNVTPLPAVLGAVTPETVVWPAELTSLTPLTDSYLYPGRVWTLEAIPPAMTWVSQDCWLRYGPGMELQGKVGQIFWAKLVGWRPTDPADFSLGGKPVYAMVPLQIGCSLAFDIAKGGYYVDVASLAGAGLSVTADACPKLRVNAGYMPGTVTLFGCGLVFDGVDTLSVDLSAVVTDPFVWTGCQLDLNIGCGLTLDGGTGALVVNPVDLAGNRILTSLVVGPGTCDLAVDLAFVATTKETLVNDVLLYRVAGGKLRMSVTKTTYTNYFNRAGLHVDRDATSPETTTFDVDVCDPACCDDCTIAFAVSASPTSGSAPLTTTLSVDTLSGCASPYTVYVDWGDGTADEIPGATGPFTVNHTYAGDGTYHIDAEATDECGFISDTATVTVTVVSAGGGGAVTCVSCGRNLASVITATPSTGDPTIGLVWDAVAQQWRGSGALACGVTLYLAFSLDCVLFYSCSGTNYAPGVALFPTIACGPPFTHSGFAVDLTNDAADCDGGGCGVISVSLAEAV